MAEKSWEEIYKAITAERPAKAQTVKQQLYAELAKCTKIVHVVVEYSGYGDSGQVEEVRFYDRDKKVVELAGAKAEKLTALIDEYVCDMLPPGWEINDGSQGTVKIDVLKQHAFFDHSYNVSETVSEPFSDPPDAEEDEE